MKQDKRFRKVLRGLEGITVWVHDIDPDAAAEGLSRQRLQDGSVIRLLDSGIKALGIGNVPEPRGNPWLNLFVTTAKIGDMWFFFVAVRLDEIVRIERNNSVKTVGTTWEACAKGAESAPRLVRAVERTVEDLIDYFVYDFHSENPTS
jgi:hypothetical protein